MNVKLRAGMIGSFLSLLAAACSSSTSSGTAPGSAACGLTMTGPKWAASCQTWSDQYCCSQQKACAAEPACAAVIGCMNACPTPRKDACLNTCAPDGGPGLGLLDAVSACSKTTPAGGSGIPATCEWPTG